jgi:hypothetical protein
MREFFTLQEKRDFMLLVSLSMLLLYIFYDFIFHVVLNTGRK